jgi:UDP-glucose 4-epimerase
VGKYGQQQNTDSGAGDLTFLSVRQTERFPFLAPSLLKQFLACNLKYSLGQNNIGVSMAILVTGAAGYIGSVTVDSLLTRGNAVVALDDLSQGHRAALDPAVPFYQGDIGDESLVAAITKEQHIDACIHFAAFASVGDSVKHPMAYFENNVEKGMKLIRCLLNAGVRQIIFSSSCAIYGEQEEIPIGEDAKKWPTNPYGWSKLFFERILDSYAAAYDLKFVALRYFNVAGASEKHGEVHEPETHLIANVLQAAAGVRKDIAVFGNDYPTPDGTAIRDYIHVCDLAEGHILALEYLRKSGVSEFMNLGTGKGHSVMEVIECARAVTGRQIITSTEGRRPGDPPELVADSRKAKRILGWTPKRSDLQTIIRSAWEWSVRHPQGYAAR